MSKQDRITDAFQMDRVNPFQSDAELERFYRQSRWLAECAECVYPPTTNSKVDPSMAKWEEIWEEFVREDQDALKKEVDEAAGRAKWEDAMTAFLKKPNVNRSLDELQLDAIAENLNGEIAKHRSWARPQTWFSVSDEYRLAKQRWELSHRLWAAAAENRIRNQIQQNWSDSSDSDLKIEFGSKSGIEYFLASGSNLVVLCFRGTEVNKFGDILTDCRAWQIGVPIKQRTNASVAATQEAVSKKPMASAKFHEGFWSALHGVWDELEKKSIWTDVRKSPEKQVWITGHSLGGALATLAAYRLVSDGVLDADQIRGIVTFGQPRVGDRLFVAGYETLKDRHYRFVNNCDVVTMIPPKSLYLVSAAVEMARSKLLGSKSKTAVDPKKEEANTRKKTYEYSDVGRIVFVNRSGKVKLMRPRFYWPIQLVMGRIGSHAMSPFLNVRQRGFIERFVPFVADHSMQEYSRVLKKECERRAVDRLHRDFLIDALTAMRAKPELQARPESLLLKSAQKAWNALKAMADKAAADKTTVDTMQTMPPADAWLKWQAVEMENRREAIENAIRSLQ